MGVNGPDGMEPSDRMWRRKDGAVRQVHCNGVSKMADPAVLVFKRLVVPVACRLESEGQYKSGHHNSYNPVCRPPPHLQPNTPTQMLLRRDNKRNRGYYFCPLSANPQKLIPVRRRLLWRPFCKVPD